MANVPPPTWQRHDWQRLSVTTRIASSRPQGWPSRNVPKRPSRPHGAEANERAAAAEQEALAAEVREMRMLVDHLKSYLTWRRAAERSTILWPQADSALKRFNLAYARYFGEDKAGFNPDQPRVPKDNPGGGRWVGAFTLPDQQQNETPSRPMVVAQSGFGTLVAEFLVPGGRRCVYNFGSISIVAPGPTNFRCSPMAHWSGLTHGTILNDNRRR